MPHPDAHTPRDAGVTTRPRSALELTMGDLTRALGLRAGRIEEQAREIAAGTFPASVYERIDAAVREAVRAADEPFVNRMMKERFRITLAVYGPRATPVWPVLGASTAQVLADCRRRMESAEWWWPHGRRAELLHAATALKQIVAEEGPGP